MSTEIKKFKEETLQQVMLKVEEMKQFDAIHLPADYSAANALRAAWFKLNAIPDKGGSPLIQVCTQASVANALLEMVTAGLNPMKHQCSFIPRGNVLTMQREYQGSIALAKRLGGLKSIAANVIYKGDEFTQAVDVETGRKKIVKHESSLENADSEIRGAYAIVTLDDGSSFAEVMTMKQIQAAWNQGPMKGNSPAHKNFPDQMSMKTVINRACKTLINSSDDAGIFGDDETAIDPVTAAVQAEIKTKANTGDPINIDAPEVTPTSLNIDDAEVLEEETDPVNTTNDPEEQYVSEIAEPGF